MSNRQDEVVIVSAVRTAIGAFGGSLTDVESTELGAVAIRGALNRINADNSLVDEVLMGQVYSEGLGPNPARIAAVKSGLPYEVPATTVNKVCGSGLKTVAFGAQAILCGDAEVIVAGGMESMSRTSHLLANHRWGQTIGNVELVDLMLKDGLWDCFYDYHMAQTAENLASKYNISREEQDRYACRSQARCQAAREQHRFEPEIVPVEIPRRRGDPIQFQRDEHPRDNVTLESLAKLKPAFSQEGKLTAGNSSGINDGAAAVVLMNQSKADELGLEPIARIVGYASAGLDPQFMGLGPALAIKKMLTKADLSLDQIDLMEVNEAFAAQCLAVGEELDWDVSKVNVNGGAISLGHPLGATGTRIVVTLLHEMKRREARYGVAALCIGGGMGISMLFESV